MWTLILFRMKTDYTECAIIKNVHIQTTWAKILLPLTYLCFSILKLCNEGGCNLRDVFICANEPYYLFKVQRVKKLDWQCKVKHFKKPKRCDTYQITHLWWRKYHKIVSWVGDSLSFSTLVLQVRKAIQPS